jgi:anti-anti-sigma factor
MATDESGFTVHTAEYGVLMLSGELDAHAATFFDEAVDKVVASGAKQLVVDVASLTFIDSSGLRSLIRAKRKMGDRSDSVVLRDPQAATSRLLEITGLVDQFPVERNG